MRAIPLEGERAYFGRFPHDCELVAELTELVKKHSINSGWFSIIGAVKGAQVAFYDQETKSYTEASFDEELEIASLTGNVAFKDGSHFIHAHALFTKADGSAVGGHLVSCRVFAAELYLVPFGGRIEREYDEQTGLYLMDLR